jgi:hypothetical protein
MAKKGNRTVGLAIRASCLLGIVGSFPKHKEARGYKLTQVTIYLHTVPAVRMNAARVPLLHVLHRGDLYRYLLAQNRIFLTEDIWYILRSDSSVVDNYSHPGYSCM